VYLRVNIAPFDERTILEEALPFPSQEAIEQKFIELKGKPVPLEVTLFSNDFDIPDNKRTQLLNLVRGRPTMTLYFPIKPLQVGLARLRVCVFYKNHLLQSFIVSAYVSAHDESASEPQKACVEMTFSSDFRRVEGFSSRGLWLGINQSEDGTHTLNIKHSQGALSRNLENKIENALEQARKALHEVSFDIKKDEDGNIERNEDGKPKKDYRFNKENFPRAGDEAGRIKRFKEDLTKLAKVGRNLYDAVLGAQPRAEERAMGQPLIDEMKKILGDEQLIQVARLRNLEDIWPWALMYDLLIDGDRVKDVCLAFRGEDGRALPYAEGVKRCKHRDPKSGRHDKTIVCPYGFWGFKHIIEQPTQPGGKKAFDDLILEVKIGATPVLNMPLATELIDIEPDHIKKMEELKFKRLSSLEEITNALDPKLNPPEPHVMYFFCHGKYDSSDNPYLQVGQHESLLPSELDELNFRWKQSHGLVFINGCHTVELKPKDLSTIMKPFVEAYTSGIIGTEITIHSFLAREFADKFFDRLLPNGASGQRVGQIIKDLRLELLMKYNPLGLVYTPYCSADLCLVR